MICSRVSQYVYVPTRDHLFQTLDLHADTLEGDVKLPLVLLGYEGKGKGICQFLSFRPLLKTFSMLNIGLLLLSRFQIH